MNENVTGITVCYNTKDSMKRAYESVRRFCLGMPIIVIDGSDPGDPCASYVKSLASDLTTVVSLGKNINHGPGMHMGIGLAKTKCVLIFDSDIEMVKACVPAMLEMMEEDTFGVGAIGKKSLNGQPYKPPKNGWEWMAYLHPPFQLININNYKKFHRYVHHGVPCWKAMLDIHKQGLSSKILKAFPDLMNSYVRHHRKTTRRRRRLSGLPPIEGGWERS